MVSLKKHHCDQKNCKLNQTHRWIPKRFGVWKNDWSLELSLQKMSKRNMSWFLIKMSSDKVTCLNVWMWLVWRIFGLDPFWLAQCQFDPERSIVDCQVIESESSLLSINCRTIAMTLAATKMTWVHKNPSYFSFPISHCFSFKTGCFGSCWVGFIPTPRHQKSRDTKVCLNIAFFPFHHPRGPATSRHGWAFVGGLGSWQLLRCNFLMLPLEGRNLQSDGGSRKPFKYGKKKHIHTKRRWCFLILKVEKS